MKSTKNFLGLVLASTILISSTPVLAVSTWVTIPSDVIKATSAVSTDTMAYANHNPLPVKFDDFYQHCAYGFNPLAWIPAFINNNIFSWFVFKIISSILNLGLVEHSIAIRTSALINALGDETLAQTARTIFLKWGKRALPYLVAASKNANSTVKKAATTLISTIKNPVLNTPTNTPNCKIASLIRNLTDASASTRTKAAKDLGKLGPSASSAVTQLILTLRDTNLNVRLKVIRALGLIGTSPEESVPALTNTVSDANSKVREYAAWAIGRIGKNIDLVGSKLTRQLDVETDLYTKKAILYALGEIGKNLIEENPGQDSSEYFNIVIPAIGSLLKKSLRPNFSLSQSEFSVLSFAASALGKMQEQSFSQLTNIQGLIDLTLKVYAANSTQEKKIQDSLLLSNALWAVRQIIKSNIDSPKQNRTTNAIVTSLLKLITDKTPPRVHSSAVLTLAKIALNSKDALPRIVPKIVSCLKDSVEKPRNSAKSALCILAKNYPKETRRLLNKLLSNDNSGNSHLRALINHLLKKNR